MAKIRIQCAEKMSNRQYHASGQPCWWARVGSTFLSLPRIRGDQALDATVEVERHPTESITIDYGVGPRGRHGVRGTLRVRSVAEVAASRAATTAAAASQAATTTAAAAS